MDQIFEIFNFFFKFDLSMSPILLNFKNTPMILFWGQDTN